MEGVAQQPDPRVRIRTQDRHPPGRQYREARREASDGNSLNITLRISLKSNNSKATVTVVTEQKEITSK